MGPSEEPTATHLREIRALAHPLQGRGDLDPLLERIGDARVVLLGEASHGTAEYYRWRAEITRRLIVEAGFDFLAVEGDWPDCTDVHRWLARSDDSTRARDVLRTFERWPTWMWANEEVAELLEWIRDWNAADPPRRVGFYGLDVYSLWDSLEVVIRYLLEHEHDAVDDAIAAYRCFEPFGEDPHEYAWATRLVPTSCEDEVVRLLTRMLEDAPRPGGVESEQRFDAEQNARVLVDAERYYRAMVRGGAGSWNIRDIHMADTLDHLLEFRGPTSRAVVWEHNTHVGDARATDMARAGMVNVGQLTRQRYGADAVVAVGFGSHHGTVIAGRGWGAPMESMDVPPAVAESHEDLLHRAGIDSGLFVFPSEAGSEWLRTPRNHRAIGVVYDPAAERAGNYVPTELGRRYDAFCFLDETSAVHPLAIAAETGEEWETEPWGV